MRLVVPLQIVLPRERRGTHAALERLVERVGRLVLAEVVQLGERLSARGVEARIHRRADVHEAGLDGLEVPRWEWRTGVVHGLLRARQGDDGAGWSDGDLVEDSEDVDEPGDLLERARVLGGKTDCGGCAEEEDLVKGPLYREKTFPG